MRLTARAWLVGVGALVLAGAGLSSLTSSSSVTSLPRMAVAAGVLSAYVSAAAIFATPREDRTRRRCLVWGAGVPTLVGVVNAVMVVRVGGLAEGVISGLPWVASAVVVSALGPRLPAARRQTGTRGRAEDPPP